VAVEARFRNENSDRSAHRLWVCHSERSEESLRLAWRCFALLSMTELSNRSSSEVPPQLGSVLRADFVGVLR
jgi:hypothetical protein